jgi:sigma-B regulation protein RsbU (phosphoserine phosphatase)
MADKQTTIFKQLIFNIVLPAIIALLLLGSLNYSNTKNILVKSSEEKNLIIADEITHILELRDMALGILEAELNKRMETISNKLVNEIFENTANIETADLEQIRKDLRMNADIEDIYIINHKGIIVNTTFLADRGLNLFELGIDHKNLLLGIMGRGEYFSERFAMGANTSILKKYTYHATSDQRYIVELGVGSAQADEIIQAINDRLNGLADKQSSIQEVVLFVGSDSPFSLNADVQLDGTHFEYYQKVLKDELPVNVEIKEGKTKLQYDYIFMPRSNSDLYKGGVIRIVSDFTAQRRVLRLELLKFIGIFGLTLVVVVMLLYRKTKVITDPIKKLVMSVNRITDGHLNERAEVTGKNEITGLSEKFNLMIAQLEEYYNELEQKVRERTAEIEKQKEEISAQRDSLEDQRNMLADANVSLQDAYTDIEEKNRHIEDSIRYAKRIQNAILPPDQYVRRLFDDYFILYLPKDIVSGDFYWVSHTDNKTFIAAVDCTGHGVPGAFMSIVGHDRLNYAVNVEDARRPAAILDSLNKGVTDTLRQARTEISVKDGMDIALLSIDFDSNKLEYAGAFNPLYLVRDSELQQFAPDKFPIGAFMGEELNKFKNNEIDIKSGDVLYVFSDGYQDQFGGPKNKKFMTKRFREMLVEINDQPMKEQKETLNTRIYDWMGEDNDQVDDILIIGIRI